MEEGKLERITSAQHGPLQLLSAFFTIEVPLSSRPLRNLTSTAVFFDFLRNHDSGFINMLPSDWRSGNLVLQLLLTPVVHMSGG